MGGWTSRIALPKSWPLRILLLAGTLAGLAMLAVFILLVWLGVYAHRHGAQLAKENKLKAAAVIEALERHRKENGAYPAELAAMASKFLDHIPSLDDPSQKTFYYHASSDGKRFWLGFDDRSGVFLPSDMIYEYDSERQQWEFMDISQGKSVNISGEAP